jgi:hypothetical protein
MAYREASLETTAAPATVWRVWSDVDHWPSWNPDMIASHLDGALALGMTGMIETKSGGKHRVVVTAYEEGHAFELESTALPTTRLAIRATITPDGDGSRITQGFEPRGLLAPVVGMLMSGMILTTFQAVLTGLKGKVEAES